MEVMKPFIKAYLPWGVVGLVAVVGIALRGGGIILIFLVLAAIAVVLFMKPIWALYVLVPALFLEAEQFSIYIGDWRGRGYHFLIGVLCARMVYEWVKKRLGMANMCLSSDPLLPPPTLGGGTDDTSSSRKRGDTDTPSPLQGEGQGEVYYCREGVGGVLRLDKILIAFLAVQGVAILFSPDKALSLKIWVLQVILALLFWVVRYFVRSEKEWKHLLNIFLLSSVVEALIGFWQVFAFYLQKTTGIVVRWGEVFHAQILQFGRPYGTFVEADWYGAFMAIPLMISVVLMAGAGTKKQRLLYGILSVIFGVAVIISGVRAAWIAVIVASVIGLVVLRHTQGLYKEYRHLVGMLGVGAVVIFLLLAILSPAWVGQIGERFMSIFDPSVWAHEPRVQTAQKAWENILKSPIIGHGPGSYKVLGIVPNVHPEQYDYYGIYPYLTNYFLTVLHDAGIIGLVVFCWMVWEGVKVCKGNHPLTPSSERRGEYAVIMGVVVLMIAYLITTGFWLGMTWFLFALLCANSSQTRLRQLANGGRIAHK